MGCRRLSPGVSDSRSDSRAVGASSRVGRGGNWGWQEAISCSYPARYRTDPTVTAGAELQLHLRAATKAMAETKARAMRAKT
eukprot:COSAG01_NODE_1333_length_10686_cov_38.703315_1_plen_82_part_00